MVLILIDKSHRHILVLMIFLLKMLLLYFFTRDAYDPAKGDRPLISYQDIYNGQQITQVAAWTDRDGNSHYAKARFEGIDVRLVMLVLLGLGIARASNDLYIMLTDRYRRRLMTGSACGIRVGKAQH